MSDQPRELPTLTVSAAARRIGVSPRTVSRWVDAGRLACFRMPGTGIRRLFESDVERFVAENTHEAAS